MASIRPIPPRSHSPAGRSCRPALSALALTALFLPLLAGCKSKSAQQGAFQPPPPEVTVIAVAPRTVELPIEAPGRLEGSREVEVRPRVSGILNRRLFEEGSAVRKGQALFEIDPLPYRAEVQAAYERHLDGFRKFIMARQPEACAQTAQDLLLRGGTVERYPHLAERNAGDLHQQPRPQRP